MTKQESGKPRKVHGKLSFQLEIRRKAVQLSELSTTYKVESGKPAPTIPSVSRMRVGHALNVSRPRPTLRIGLPDRFVTPEIAAKSLRKVQTVIRDAGTNNAGLALQGRLVAGDVIAEDRPLRVGEGGKADAAMTCPETTHLPQTAPSAARLKPRHNVRWGALTLGKSAHRELCLCVRSSQGSNGLSRVTS